MRTPEDYIDNELDIVFMPRDGYAFKESDVIKFIEAAQKESYNQAIQDVENITPEGWISIVEVKKLKIK